MTDRHSGYLVVLAEDIREDDTGESTLAALRMIRGVQSVEPVLADFAATVEASRRDDAWREALRQLLREGPGD